MLTFIFGVGVLFATFVFLMILFKLSYRVPSASVAFVITGQGAKLPQEVRDQLAKDAQNAQAEQAKQTNGTDSVTTYKKETLDFKVVTGRGVFIRPGVQKLTKISLAAEEAIMEVESRSSNGIPLSPKAVVLYKIGDDALSIARAARRFDDRDQMTKMIQNVFEGHLRAVVGTMEAVDVYNNREALATSVRGACNEDVERLGLSIQSFQIQGIGDPTKYMDNYGARETAAMEKEARIAKANNDREAAEREAEANALKAKAVSASEIQQAEARALAETAAAKANQAGPLAEAEAKQEVILKQTRIAELAADLNEKELESTVRRPADAEAYKQTTLAEAARNATVARANAEAEAARVTGTARADAEKAQGLAQAEVTKQKGLAQAEVTKAQGLAEGDAIRAKAEALAENQDAVITQEMVRQLPAVVAATSEAWANIGNMTVFDGAKGVSDGFTQAAGMGLGLLPVLRDMMNGAASGPDNGGGQPAKRTRPKAPQGGPSQTTDRPPAAKPAAPTGDVGSAFDKVISDADASATASSEALQNRADEASASMAKLTEGLDNLDLSGRAEKAGEEFDRVYEETDERADRVLEGANEFADGLDQLMDKGEGLFDRGEELADRVSELRTRARRRR